jgi:predicted alpha/beta hydrolase
MSHDFSDVECEYFDAQGALAVAQGAVQRCAAAAAAAEFEVAVAELTGGDVDGCRAVYEASLVDLRVAADDAVDAHHRFALVSSRYRVVVRVVGPVVEPDHEPEEIVDESAG